ncbi:MAG TPA: hypothetical protein VNC78_08880 [Actinomycetota bacterium]|nr:hypothetical protein [Actinomycetota bacterium]
MAEGNGSTTTTTEELHEQILELRKDHEVAIASQSGAQATQAATMAGADATQAAMQAGQASTFAATHAGTWSTMAASWVAFVVGIFMGLAISATRR